MYYVTYNNYTNPVSLVSEFCWLVEPALPRLEGVTSECMRACVCVYECVCVCVCVCVCQWISPNLFRLSQVLELSSLGNACYTAVSVHLSRLSSPVAVLGCVMS